MFYRDDPNMSHPSVLPRGSGGHPHQARDSPQGFAAARK